MSTRAGIEIDGTHATVVLAHGSGDALAVETVSTVTGDTLEELLTAATAPLRAGDSVRVALLSPAVGTATIEGSSDLLTRAAFTRAALAATAAAEGVTAAGYVADAAAAADGRLTTALAVTAPADIVARVQAALRGRHHVEVVASALTHGPVEGVSLVLGWSSSDIVLVVDGAPVAARQLRAGGLEALTALLAGDAGRVQAALTRTGADPIAAAEVDRWVRAVAQETAIALGEFGRRGLRTEDTVFAHGPGAAAIDLASALSDSGVSVRTHKVLAAIPGAPSGRPAGVGAYLAAATLGAGLPHAAFVDRVDVARARRDRARARRRQHVATLAVSASLLVAAAAGPGAYAQGAHLLAERHANTVLKDVRATGPGATTYQVGTLTAAATQLRVASSASSDVVAAALGQSPVTVTDLTVGTDGTITVAGTATDFGQVRTWASTVRTTLTRSGLVARVDVDTAARTTDGLRFTAHVTATPGPTGPATGARR